MSGREPAWRVLAQEFQASLEEEKGTGERAASHLLSPLGARMNRVLVVGTLAAAESIGRDEGTPFLRARLTDPTGSLTVTAGSFQPRALAALKAWTSPGAALVVGKAHLFRGRDGTAYPSIRLEAARAITEPELRLFWADAVEATRERIRRVRTLREARTPPPSIAGDAHLEEAARAALARYPTIDPATFVPPLAAVVAQVAARGAPSPSPSAARPAATVTRAPPPTRPDPPSAAERAWEASFLDIVDELADGSVDGYADLRDALARAGARGLTEAKAEELLNRLEESGAIEEPIVGKLRRG